MQYVIIGGSIAGISAAQAIRESDPSGAITLVSGEKISPYYRPLIPLLIAGTRTERDIAFDHDPMRENDVTQLVGTVVRIDTKTRNVLLASGERVHYDSLLIASGGAAMKPPIPDIEGSGVYPLRNMAHAEQIRDAADRVRNAVVIGGGLVGIKAALALRERRISDRPAIEVSVVEVLPEILSNRLDRRGAATVRAAVEKEGITILAGQKVSRIIRSGSRVTGVKLGTGKTLAADMVVVAAGVKPNISFLAGSGVRTKRGVLVDESLRTNVPGIFAAGDVAEGKELITGETAVSGLWTSAREMGRAAGVNMTGGKIQYPGFLTVMNATEIAGVPFISVGLIEPDSRKYRMVTHEDGEGYWKLVFDGEFLVGAVFLGDISRAGIYTNLIKNRIPVSRIQDRLMKRAVTHVDFVNA